MGILGLLILQVTLGILTVLLRKPADIASAHVAVGSLLLVTVWVTAMRAIGVVRANEIRPKAGQAGVELQYAGHRD
jgi:heme A synthase